MTTPGDRARRHADSHRAAERAATTRKVVIGVATLAILGGTAAAVTYAVNTTNRTPTNSIGTASPSSAGATTGSPDSSTPAASTSGASPSSSSGAVPGAVTPACVAESKAGDAFAAAAVNVANDWRTHTSAQANVDAGKISAATAEAAWKASKARGQGDLAAYAQTKTAYDSARGACAKAGSGTTVSQQLVQCIARSGDVAKLETAAAPVAAGWTEHIANMKGKAHSDLASYMTHWRMLVAKAPQQLKTYQTAADALAKAPACS